MRNTNDVQAPKQRQKIKVYSPNETILVLHQTILKRPKVALSDTLYQRFEFIQSILFKHYGVKRENKRMSVNQYEST
jgi:hypothetical protein